MAAIVLVASVAGCTSFSQYIANGWKVGPNYAQPLAQVADQWIDQADLRTEPNPESLAHWWTVFDDPKLNRLIAHAYRQNLTLKEAGFRVLQARAQLAITTGQIFPQQQSAFGDYRRSGVAVDPANIPATGRFSDSWDFGFSLAWELDFWGRFRRAIAAASDNLDAAAADYDGVLVTLLGDVAANYVTVRTTQERIRLLQANVKLQQGVLNYIRNRLEAGWKQTELDLDQSVSDLRQTEAAIPQLEITQRQAENRLCILLGMPPTDLSEILGGGPIPTTPPEVVLGIPADLLRRRPDVRRAERLAAAQAEQIGIAEADLYPAFTISGNLGYRAADFADLFRETAFNGTVGPSFNWKLLNYGRIINNVRYQDARFQELATAYQNKVLQAQEEVENGLVTYLRSQRRSKLLAESVESAQKAVKIVIAQYEKGAVDFNRYALIQQNFVTQQDLSAQARGQIAQGLISVYRALGGGWEIRFGMPEPTEAGAEAEITEQPPEPLPAPLPEPL